MTHIYGEIHVWHPYIAHRSPPFASQKAPHLIRRNQGSRWEEGIEYSQFVFLMVGPELWCLAFDSSF